MEEYNENIRIIGNKYKKKKLSLKRIFHEIYISKQRSSKIPYQTKHTSKQNPKTFSPKLFNNVPIKKQIIQ